MALSFIEYQKSGGGSGGTVSSQFSISGDGSSGNKLQLTNDTNTPGIDKLYGTDYSGAKGYISPDVQWYNLVKAGADNTGSIDVSSFIVAAMAAGHKYIYLPAGSYLISTPVPMLDNVVIKGDSRKNTAIKLTTNITAFTLGTSTGFNCQFKDFRFEGTNGTTGNSLQKGIVMDSITGVYIDDVGGYFMGGFVFSIGNNGLLSGNQFVMGNIISNCYVETCGGGVMFDVRGEYNTVQGCNFSGGNYGVYVKGGNNRIIGNNCSLNGYGIYLDAGDNDGHGIAVGNTLNHSTTAGIYCTGVTNGFTFEANDLFASNLTILNSAGIDIIGGKMSGTTITLTNATNCNINFPHFVTIPTLTITSSTGVMFENVLGGMRITNWEFPTLPYTMSSQNSLFNYGGTSAGAADSLTTTHKFFQQVLGIGGAADGNNRGFYANSFRFENNGSGTFGNDPHVIYSSGGTNNTFTVWNSKVSGLYTLLVDSNGNTGIRTGSPTSYLHIAAGTAAANHSPLKLTTGVNLTTPEAGAFEYDGLYPYFTTLAGIRSIIPLISAGVSGSVANGQIPIGNNGGYFTAASLTQGRGVSIGNSTGNITLAFANLHAIFTPTTGQTITLQNNTYNIINPAGALVALTVTLPSSPADGDMVQLKFTKAITTVTYSGGTVSDGITSPVVGELVVLLFDVGTSTWY